MGSVFFTVSEFCLELNIFISEIALGGTCTASPTGQCTDTNAACHATHFKCECTSSFFANKKTACASGELKKKEKQQKNRTQYYW